MIGNIDYNIHIPPPPSTRSPTTGAPQQQQHHMSKVPKDFNMQLKITHIKNALQQEIKNKVEKNEDVANINRIITCVLELHPLDMDNISFTIHKDARDKGYIVQCGNFNQESDLLKLWHCFLDPQTRNPHFENISRVALDWTTASMTFYLLEEKELRKPTKRLKRTFTGVTSNNTRGFGGGYPNSTRKRKTLTGIK